MNGYDIAASGALTQVEGSPFASGNQPLISALTPDGRFLYTANFNAGGPFPNVPDNISGYEVASSGVPRHWPARRSRRAMGPRRCP